MKKGKRILSKHKKSKIKLTFKKPIILLILLFLIMGVFYLIDNNTKKLNLSAEILRSKAYETAPTDEKGKLVEIKDQNGKIIEAVYFDAYFIKDLDGDGVAESRLRRKL